jgi:adenylosuccinate lyase
MMAAARGGADRQEMHERLREHAMAAWQEVQAGRPNPLIAYLKTDTWITTYLSPEQIESLANIGAYTGIAPQRARETAERVRSKLGK